MERVRKFKPLLGFMFITNIGFANHTYIQPEVGRDVFSPTIEQYKEFLPHTPWQPNLFTNNVWWMPLEFNDSENDMVEAIITKPGPWYEISIGTQRELINPDRFNVGAAVGRLIYTPNVGYPWRCTATHVGNGYVVTAGHCLEDPNVVLNTCENTKIQWDFRRSRVDFPKEPEPSKIGQCQKIISWNFKYGDSSALDHAIMKVDIAPEASVEIAKTPNLQVGDSLYQLSHPGGVPLVLAQNCQITKLPFEYYQHNCWGASGSSGSALIDATNNKLVAVLSMGDDTTFFSIKNDISPVGCFSIETGEVDRECLPA